MVKHAQKICPQFADKLFECVWPFGGLALKGLTENFIFCEEIVTAAITRLTLETNSELNFCATAGQSVSKTWIYQFIPETPYKVRI